MAQIWGVGKTLPDGSGHPPTQATGQRFMSDLWSYLAVEGSGLSRASSGIPSLRLLPELAGAVEKVRLDTGCDPG